MSSIAVQVSPAPVRRTTAAPARPHLRLTRRGRLVLAAVAATPLVAAAVWFGVSSGSAAAGGASAGTPASVEHVTVHPGESLWQIAETVAPHDDPREVIDAIVDMNGLQSSVLTPGESLAIPAQYSK